jgi:diguanylate cyclase (GGDEF)-like protein
MIVAVVVALLGYIIIRKLRRTNRMLIEANMKLEIQSMRDPLTGLLTRHAFHDSMRARMKVTDRRLGDTSQPPHALALLDIDHFKMINDKFGHGVGDQVLIEVSNRLTQIMRENDKLMRWTGEEFLLFLNNITTDNLERVIQRVLSVVGSTAVKINDKVLNVTVSVGYISLAHGKESDIDEHWEKALKLADAALYKAKINGRNQAVGIPNNTIVLQELDAVLAIDLDDLTEQEKIVVSKITGPLQRGKISGSITVEC